MNRHVVAALGGVKRAEFALVRDSVEISDSALSKQIATLEAAGYVEVDKGKVGRRPRTWLKITENGQDALAQHVAALQAIAGRPIVRACVKRGMGRRTIGFCYRLR